MKEGERLKDSGRLDVAKYTELCHQRNYWCNYQMVEASEIQSRKPLLPCY